jgi:uncharacterized protein (TIGR02996 family)
MTSNPDPFLAQIINDPTNWTLKAVYADYLEENNQFDLAFAYRWMSKAQAHPYHRTHYPPSRYEQLVKGKEATGRRVPEIYSWAWFAETRYQLKGVYAHSYLPPHRFQFDEWFRSRLRGQFRPHSL